MQADQSPIGADRTARAALLGGALFGGLAVVLGAFAAHAMKAHYDEAQLRTFETGVRYQMYHALALLLCGVLGTLGHKTRAAAVLFASGILLFSGSLYGLVLLDARWLGPVTPIGGVAFVAGWLALGLGARHRS